LNFGRVAIFLMAASVLAGGLTWGLGEAKLLIVEPKLFPMETMGVKHMGRTQVGDRAAERATAARTFGALGGLTGLLLGVAAGLGAGSVSRAVRGGVVGLAVGLVVTAAVTFFMVPMYHRFKESIGDDIVASLIMHGSNWAPVGIASGIAVALAVGAANFGRWIRLILAGLIGSLVGTAIYELVGAVAMANDETGEVLAQSSTARLMAMVAVALGTAVVLALAVAEKRKREGALKGV
jgi:large-conductance mechanosensitive channel